MQDVIKSINETYEVLVSKVQAYETKFQQVQTLLKDVEKRSDVLDAKDNRLSALERIYSKYDDFDGEKRKFELEKTDYNSKMSEIEKAKKELDKKSEDVKKEIEALEAKKVVLGKQANALKDKEAAFSKKQEDLKMLLSGQTVKDMIK